MQVFWRIEDLAFELLANYACRKSQRSFVSRYIWMNLTFRGSSFRYSLPVQCGTNI